MTQRPGHQLPCTVASCDGEALRQRAFFLFRVPTLFLAGLSFFLLAAHCVARHARTTDERTTRPTCGPQAWLTGKLHEGGDYGACAHRCGGPLSSQPLSPCPYNAVAPKGPAFSFLNYLNY